MFYISIAFLIYYTFYLLTNYKNGYKLVACLIFVILGVRQFTEAGFDDLHPLTMNKIPHIYLHKSKYLFVTPKMYNKSILLYPQWVSEIKNFAKKNDKIIALHGVTHEMYNPPIGYCEFSKKLSEKYISEGIQIFSQAFGFKPKFFKAPCYGLHDHNKQIIESYGMHVIGPSTMLFNKLFHPDYDHKMYLLNQFNLLF
tara:strand:- start:6183 stop:6776 length:594 start_codon:yes stop_codon:yes gene_type:complete